MTLNNHIPAPEIGIYPNLMWMSSSSIKLLPTFLQEPQECWKLVVGHEEITDLYVSPTQPTDVCLVEEDIVIVLRQSGSELSYCYSLLHFPIVLRSGTVAKVILTRKKDQSKILFFDAQTHL